MPTPFPRGRFVWHELMTSDPDAAVGFYAKVVGWKAEPWAHLSSYRLWVMAGTPRGGLMPLTDEARRMGAPPRWMPYVGVPDVDATVRHAQALGARVSVAPRDIPSVGRFATLADPQGATFSVLQPEPSESVGSDVPGLGDFSWHELATLDWKAAWEFYQKLFGWEHASSVEMGPGETYWMFKRGGSRQTAGGMYNRPAGTALAPQWLCYALVPNADRAAEVVTRSGGKVVTGPMDVPGGDRVAMCIDPHGVAFAVHARAAAPTKRAPRRAKPAARKRRRPGKAKARKAKPKKAKRARAKRRRTR